MRIRFVFSDKVIAFLKSANESDLASVGMPGEAASSGAASSSAGAVAEPEVAPPPLKKARELSSYDFQKKHFPFSEAGDIKIQMYFGWIGNHLLLQQHGFHIRQ